jgi:uncharacterized protein (DUF2141 family)
MRPSHWLTALVLLVHGVRAVPQGSPHLGSIEVTIAGVRVQQGGDLMVALYDHESSWLSTDSALSARRIPVVADSVVIVFDSLPYGTGYAVAVIHDANRNNRLDMRWFPLPKPREGAGVSRNTMGFGKPRYDKARFALDSEREQQRIVLRY